MALQSAIEAAGGLDGVAALSVAGQQHGMVCLDEDGAVVRDALLWNDTRSAAAADELVRELAAPAWADARRHGTGRFDHDHQAALAGRARTRARRAHGGGLPAARLAHLAARAAAPA